MARKRMQPSKLYPAKEAEIIRLFSEGVGLHATARAVEISPAALKTWLTVGEEDPSPDWACGRLYLAKRAVERGEPVPDPHPHLRLPATRQIERADIDDVGELTATVRKDILALVVKSVPVRTAALSVGVSPRTWVEWQQEASTDPESPYAKFFEEIEIAQARAIAQLITNTGSPKDTISVLETLASKIDRGGSGGMASQAFSEDFVRKLSMAIAYSLPASPDIVEQSASHVTDKVKSFFRIPDKEFQREEFSSSHEESDEGSEEK